MPVKKTTWIVAVLLGLLFLVVGLWIPGVRSTPPDDPADTTDGWETPDPDPVECMDIVEVCGDDVIKGRCPGCRACNSAADLNAFLELCLAPGADLCDFCKKCGECDD